MDEDGEAQTLGLLKELRDLAEEVGHGHSDFSHRFHELLRRVQNPNLPDVAKDFGFRVFSMEKERPLQKRTVAVCANVTVAIAAWECAKKIYPEDRWLLTWGGMVQYDSER